MTGQISDWFRLYGRRYNLLEWSEDEPFDAPAMLGATPSRPSTSCWRGYHSEYALSAGRLVLRVLRANLLSEDGPPYSDLQGPMLNGVTPKPQDHLYTRLNFNNHYTNLDYLVGYSGGLLLGHGRLRTIFLADGFASAWEYRTVRELVFDEGRMTKNTDRSGPMALIREKYLAGLALSGTAQQKTRDEIRRMAEARFDRRYARLACDY